MIIFIEIVLLISFEPLLFVVSIPFQFTFHVIVLLLELYDPPAKSDLDSSILQGSVSTIVITPLPI